MSTKPKLPHIEIFSTDELHRMGLVVMLQRQGIEDPHTFLAENKVDFVTAFKHDVGMAITINSITPKPPKKVTADE